MSGWGIVITRKPETYKNVFIELSIELAPGCRLLPTTIHVPNHVIKYTVRPSNLTSRLHPALGDWKSNVSVLLIFSQPDAQATQRSLSL